MLPQSLEAGGAGPLLPAGGGFHGNLLPGQLPVSPPRRREGPLGAAAGMSARGHSASAGPNKKGDGGIAAAPRGPLHPRTCVTRGTGDAAAAILRPPYRVPGL